MTSAAALGIAVVFGWAIATVLFGKKRAKWRPFGGLIKHDRRTGATSLVFTLPSRRRKGRRR